MPKFIVTANYTADAVKGMLAKPADRAQAVKPLVDALGGKLIAFYMTTGRKDLLMILEGDDVTDVLAGLMVSAAGGVISNIETVRAFDSEEFTAIQKKAQSMVTKLNPPGS